MAFLGLLMLPWSELGGGSSTTVFINKWWLLVLFFLVFAARLASSWPAMVARESEAHLQPGSFFLPPWPAVVARRCWRRVGRFWI
jgi:hypothetical protein